jgi:hypothetical protein
MVPPGMEVELPRRILRQGASNEVWGVGPFGGEAASAADRITGILPVPEHGQDGHDTLLAGAQRSDVPFRSVDVPPERKISSASITASALSRDTYAMAESLGFCGLRASWILLAHPDQGSPLGISRWNASVPPLIYSIPFHRDHDSPFNLPASCREARRPIKLSIPLRTEPSRYSGYRTCEPTARSSSARAASNTTLPPGGGQQPPSPLH